MPDLTPAVAPTQETPQAEATQTVEPTTSTEEQDITTLTDSVEADASQKEDGKTAEVVVPEKYELKMPEGVEVNTAMLDAFTPIFKELKLPTDGVQKLVDAYIPFVNSAVESSRQESLKVFKETVDGWKTETMKELGENAKTSISYVGKAIQKFGDNELREVLHETGVGNHKALVRMLAKVGKTISEDAFVEGRQSSKVDPLLAMYPSMKQ